MYKYIVLFTSLFLYNSYVYICAAKISCSQFRIESTVYDFGDVYDNQGPLSCLFKIENIGEEPFYILEVVTSCSCTKTSWTNGAILPGQCGLINAVYSNKEGPHPFDKSILVKLSCVDNAIVLHLKGNTLSVNKTRRKEQSYKIGPIVLSKQKISLGKFYSESNVDCILSVYNSYRDTTLVMISSPANVSFLQNEEFRIPPKSKLDIRYVLSVPDQNYGYRVDSVGVISCNVLGEKYDEGVVELEYTVNSKSSESIGEKPLARLSEKHVILGDVCKKSQIKKELSITNVGSAPLNVFYVGTRSNVSLDYSPTVLFPNDKLDVLAEFDFKSMPKGKGVLSIDFYTDSIEMPVQHVYFTYHTRATCLLHFKNICRDIMKRKKTHSFLSYI